MRPADLAAELEAAGIDVHVPRDLTGDVRDVVHHTDAVGPGALFCCVRGSRFDGHDAIAEVLARGAVAVLVAADADLAAHGAPEDAPRLVVPDVRAAMGPAAAAVHGHPSHDLTVIGVTGTNGKTTTVAMVDAIARAAGKRSRVIGTLTSVAGAPPTTPDAPELQARLAGWLDEGVDFVAMEVSSHALTMGRVEGTRFAAAGFTTLGEDHLDLHGSMQAYFEAKASLFRADRIGVAVVRADDEWGARLLDRLDEAIEAVPYALADAAPIEPVPAGTRLHLDGRLVDLPLVGTHNVANALCAARICRAVGIDEAAIRTGLADLAPVRGRFELIDRGQPFTVAVDYAHTPDALAAVLDAARDRATASGGRVLVVFGCGGDRDTTKRAPMGAIAASRADVVVVTSDNPRSEDPERIIDAVIAGIPEDQLDHVVRLADRSRAIHHAAREAREHDVVVIAGKGHETTQTFVDRVIDFDDVAVASAALDELVGPTRGDHR